jgi:deoxyribodipyrimidine photolyase-related protein
LSVYMNNGLLTPRQVLQALDDFMRGKFGWGIFNKVYSEISGEEIQKVNLNSIEGFIRQIIGWREWMKGLYDNIYAQDLRQYNFWNNNKSLPDYFYSKSGFDELATSNFPLWQSLQNLYDYSYNHHIERLMIFSNWFMLNEYDPQQCFDWFMEMYIDAYDWVMVGNVIGMGLYADGGIFATKPYICGGNYIKKMSDYPDSKIWDPIWTDLFWQFLLKHKDFFATNPRLNMLIVARLKRDLTKG